MNSYDQIIKQIIATSPSWEKDGGGIRGRTIAPILSGLSSFGLADSTPQIFNQQNNETVQRVAGDPIPDLTLDGGAGGGGSLLPFQLVPTTDEEGAQKILVVYGEINGTSIQGMSKNNTPQYLITPLDNDFVYIILTFNDFREINSRTIGHNSEVPENTNTKIHIKIGQVGIQNEAYYIIQQTRVGHIFIREYLVSINGILHRDYIQTYVENPIAIANAEE